MTAQCLSVFVTAASQAEAERIAQTVVEENLAACATLLPGGRSIYRWKGTIEQADECALILKITADRFDALQNRIKMLHSYDCPCIVAWPIVAGNPDYLSWLAGEDSK